MTSGLDHTGTAGHHAGVPGPRVEPVKVDVVVPVHGNWPEVERCLQSLLGQSLAPSIYVVDDCSPDDTAHRVAMSFPECQLLRTSANVGFAAACNLGIRAGSGSVVVLVNSDVEADEDMLSHLVSEFDAQEVGACAGVISRRDGTVDAVGVVIDPTLAGYLRYAGSAGWDAESPQVGCPYGAVAAYRRTALDEVGLLDEAFFMYGEELELGLRLLANGWRTAVAASALATHAGGATIGAGSPRQRYLAGFGRAYTLRVYRVLHSRFGPRAVLVEAIAAIARSVAERDLASIRGRLDGWRRGRGVEPRPLPTVGLEPRIGLLESIRLRRADYWQRRGKRWTTR